MYRQVQRAVQLIAKDPSVSVIIPTYNRAQLLPRTIGSVLDQSYQDFEIIVVDDASSDSSEEVVQGFNDPRIRYLRHDANRGGSEARNTGIRVSRGKHIAFLDSDDEWLPSKLEKQMEIFKFSGEKVGAVYCAHYVQHDAYRLADEPKGQLHTGNVYRFLLGGWCPPTTSLFVVSREFLMLSGLFDSSLPSFQDYDLWLRLSQLCKFEVVREPLVIKHEHALDQIAWNPIVRLRALEIVMEKWGPEMVKEVGKAGFADFRLIHLSNIHANAVFANIKQGERRESIKSFLKYLRIFRRIRPMRVFVLVVALVLGARAYEYFDRRWTRRGWKKSLHCLGLNQVERGNWLVLDRGESPTA